MFGAREMSRKRKERERERGVIERMSSVAKERKKRVGWGVDGKGKDKGKSGSDMIFELFEAAVCAAILQ